MNVPPVVSFSGSPAVRRKRVLIVSPHFPPINAPDHQRVRMSLGHFREYGWDPVVLAVAPQFIEGLRDPLLVQTLPGDVLVLRCSALPAGWTRPLGLGNIAYRAWFQLKAAGSSLLRKEHFDLVYFSTTQFVTTALGPKWWRDFAVPYVVDIQDPWRTDYYERPGAPRPPGGWKYRFARWQAARLEKSAWKDAAGFISVAERYLTDLRARYAWFGQKPSAVIPFGAAETDFAAAAANIEIPPAFEREPGAIHLVSMGAIGPIMGRAIEHLFSMVRALRDLDPAAAARLRFHFIGTSYAPSDRAEPSVQSIASRLGVGDLVQEQPSRVGYFTAIKTMLAADALVIPGSDDPGYSPSKLAGCFLANKPAMVIAPGGSSLDRMAHELGFATIVRFPAMESTAQGMDFFQNLSRGLPPSPAAARNCSLFDSTYTARARTFQQCELFDRALRFNQNHAGSNPIS